MDFYMLLIPKKIHSDNNNILFCYYYLCVIYPDIIDI